MRAIRSWTVCALMLLGITALAGEPVTVVNLTPKQGELATLLKGEVSNARRMGKVPFVQLTAEWCGPCKALRASMGDPLMQDAFAGTHVIRLDVDEWEGKLQPLGMMSDVIPKFYALNPAARPEGKTITGGAWGEDIPKNMAPPLKKYFRAHGAGGSGR